MNERDGALDYVDQSADVYLRRIRESLQLFVERQLNSRLILIRSDFVFAARFSVCEIRKKI